ncbi:uncharacterized protein JCM6883_002273 [Sporobolomyces salmoneus]|uniref:uncharacterized protein n=1 Tax=Sporobolomyces salmoneus TaxID=183962 RepID=UPI00317A6B3A
MDDNPWGASSVDGSPNLTSSATPPDQPEATSRLSLDAEEEDASWGNDEVEQVDEVRDVEERKEEESDIDQQPTEDVEAGTRVGEQEEEVPAVQAADQSEQGRDGSATLESSTTLPPPVPLVDETPPGSHEPPMDDFPEGDVGLSAPDASLSPTTKDSETFTVPPPPLPTTSTEPSQAPPMDDFDDFDDDDDFGEMGEAGEDGEGDDDFGDFGDAAPLDESAFEASSEPFPLTQHTSEPALTPQPVPSTSFLPPLRLDLSNRPTRRSVAPQLRDFVSSAWGDVSDKVNDEPERQVEGVAQILVTEESRNLLSSLSSLPPLRPLDWRRSKIRREHLISMGIPVNLDDSNDPKPLSSLSTSSPRLSGTQSRPSSAPPGASPLPFSSSRVPSRSSTPFADRERTRRTASPPPLDKNLADQLLSLKEDDLTLMSLAKLKSVAADLEKISVDASEILTHALLMREKESQDKETYNGMISDLVSAAAKMKTTSSTTGAGRGRDPKRQGMSWDTAAVAKAEDLRLSSFTSQTAHTLGESIRAHIQKQAPGKAAIVQITSGSTEQLLYFSTTAEGTLLDNKVWAQRKWRSVIRFGKSTASLNVKWSNGKVPSHYAAPETEYACHGGGYPLRVKGVEPIVGVVIVSGLTQEEDHQSIVDVLEKFIQDGEPVSE